MEQVLDSNIKDVCRKLGRTKLASLFYLAGGTALALQLGHRRSLDLDFFLNPEEHDFPSDLVAKEIESLFRRNEIYPVVREGGCITWDINGIKTTFMEYPFCLAEPLVEGEKIDPALKGIYLASAVEIAVMKAYAISRKAAFRDYIDLYFVLREGISDIETIIEYASSKYVIGGASVFSEKMFLEQLTYLGDIEDCEAGLNLVFGCCPERKELKSFLKSRVRRFLDKHCGECSRESSR